RLARVMVIDEMVDELTVWDAVEIEAFYFSLGFSRTIRVAIVDARAGEECNSNTFNELFLRNRGWTRIRVFVDRLDALFWLGESEPQESLIEQANDTPSRGTPRAISGQAASKPGDDPIC